MKLALLKQMNAARRERRACVLATKLSDGSQRFVAAERFGEDPLSEELETALRAGKSATVERDGESYFLTEALCRDEAL
jgi:xanthine dehydrogenase accessory factor